jgi:hypothetical protein
VNWTNLINLDFTNDMISVSEDDSMVIDEQDEFSDQTQSVEPSDKAESDQQSESD